jgi:hypothetical protein
MSADSDPVELEENIIEQIPQYDIQIGLRNLINQVEKLAHKLPFDCRLVEALLDIHHNRVTEVSVDACLSHL